MRCTAEHPASLTAFGFRVSGFGFTAYPAFSFFSKISPTSAGFALPLLSFITCPLSKFSAATLPALKSAAGPGFAAIA